MISPILLYRKQYIITNTMLNTVPDHWEHLTVGDGHINVFYHPELEVFFQRAHRAEIVLVGYILDPRNPAFTNLDILRILVQEKTFKTTLKRIEGYAGRYILLYTNETGCYLLSDTLGSREVFYCFDANKYWVGAQPNILASLLNVSLRDDKEYWEYVHSESFINNQNAVIGDETRYKSIFHLLPNYYLDLRTNQCHRYWPHENIQVVSIEDAVNLVSQLLQGTLMSAYHRYNLAIGFTSGGDSRLLVSCSSPLKDKLYYFINQYSNMDDKHPDLCIPARLAKTLGIKFHIHALQSSDDLANDVDFKHFEEIYKKNYDYPIRTILPAHYFLYKELGHIPKLMNILTIGSEITRNYYPVRDVSNARTCAKMVNYPNIYYVIQQCDAWLTKNREISKAAHVNPTDLFYWEQRVGNWGAQGATLADTYRETLSPFTCREILTTMLGVPANCRSNRSSNNKLYRSIMKKMWAEVLSEPINPPRTLKQRISNVLSEVGVMQMLRRFKLHLDT